MDGGLVTVVIPALNEAGFIENCLGTVSNQDYADLQIIVIDGGSTDGTGEIVKRLSVHDSRIELIHNPRKLIPISLNLAVDAARGEWLVRIDAHSTVPPDYVTKAVEHLSTGKWGGVGGRKDGMGLTTSGAAIAVAMGSKFGVGNSTYHHGEHAQVVDHIPFGCYPVSLIRDIGGWDENLAVNQDFEFDQRLQKAGHQLLFDPGLRIIWHSRQSFGALYKQYRRYGQGKTVVFGLHPDSVKPRQVAPAGLVAALVAAAAVAPRAPRLAALAVAPYAAFLAAGTAAEHHKLPTMAEKLSLPVAFASMHIGFGEGLWRGAAKLARARFTGGRDANSH